MSHIKCNLATTSVCPITPMTTLIINIDHYNHFDNRQITMEVMHRDEIMINDSFMVRILLLCTSSKILIAPDGGSLGLCIDEETFTMPHFIINSIGNISGIKMLQY